MKKILLLLLIAISLSGCEKDDICTDETTPRLVVEFYDISNPSNLKNVLNLKVQGVGAATPIVFNSGLELTDPNRYIFNGSKMQLPLKIDENVTDYILTINSLSTTAFNVDNLKINYAHQNVYVSRACGYKTIFKLLDPPNGVIKSDAVPADTFWIQDINIITTNIETENETHIKIYF